jgi:predicted DNA-binding protein (UPF0251 family)
MRPKIKRHIGADHWAKLSLFKPNGVPASALNNVKINLKIEENSATLPRASLRD